MLLPPFRSLITVTFSTPTPGFNSYLLELSKQNLSRGSLQKTPRRERLLHHQGKLRSVSQRG
jgi:hypothetical protein